MSYALKPREKLARGILRIANEQADAIQKHLNETRPERQEESVHRARTSVKKLRALLRLVRGRLGRKHYRDQSRALRRVARTLSQLRDVEVQINALDWLPHAGRRQITPGTLSSLLPGLRRRRKALLRAATNRKQTLHMELRTARRKMKDWRLKGLKWSELLRETQRTYARCRRSREESEQARTTENLHHWRRRTKDLWYHLTVLQPVCRPQVARLVEGLEHLGVYLGADHDLALLEAAAEAAKLDPIKSRRDRRLIHRRRIRWQRAASKLGHWLFLDKPVCFSRRLERYGQVLKKDRL